MQNIVVDKQHADYDGKGRVHLLKTVTRDGSLRSVYIQLPRAGFSIRPDNLGLYLGYGDSGPVPKYRLTLKFNQKVAVDQLRDAHSMIKAVIVDSFHTILPMTTYVILGVLEKNDENFPKNLFEQVHDLRRFTKAKELFARAARKKLDEIFVFGGSEEDFDSHRGARTMVNFVPAKSTHDGKKAWTVDVAASSMRSADSRDYRPLFKFTACEGPEKNREKTTIVPNENVLEKLSPVDGKHFSRDGIADVCLSHIHVRDDESSVFVNISPKHLHIFQDT